MSFPVQFFRSRELRDATKEATVAYLVLRADILSNECEVTKRAKLDNLLVSGLDVQMIARLTALSELTIERILDEMIKRRWLTKNEAYGKVLCCLGEIKDFELKFYLDDLVKNEKSEPEPEKSEVKSEALSPSEIIRRKLAESRALVSSKEEAPPKPPRELSEDTRTKIARTVMDSLEETPIRAKDIVQLFAAKYEKKYGEPCPLITEGERGNPHAVTYVYVGRAIKWSKSAKQVYEVVEFMFENWDKIKSGLGLDGRPTFNMIGSSKLWPRFVCCKTEGIPTPKTKTVVKETVTHRFDPTKPAPETGW